MQTLAILGSTGSVGTQTIQVLSRNPGKYNVRMLAANSNWCLMEEQIRMLNPSWAIMTDAGAAAELRLRVMDHQVKVLSGENAMLELLAKERFQMVVAAMVGHPGLLPVITAIKAGSNIALANKEVLVMAGHIITQLCRANNVRLLPLDSEHSAIFQCLAGQNPDKVKKLILTASGGPFRGKTGADLINVSPAETIKHPNWQMGAKISVDSATLMNKGLEVIEARWLFSLDVEQIDVLVHPQSIIHSMVEFIDGSVIGQLGVPSMELPIQYALSWPDRWPGSSSHFIDWLALKPLSFEQPDLITFPCLQLARDASIKGGNAPAILSTANDICVEGFLSGNIGFNGISAIVAEALATIPWQVNPSLDSIISTIELTKTTVPELIKSLE